MSHTDRPERLALKRQRALTLLATGSIALLAAVIWLSTEIPTTEHFFSLMSADALTWAWRVSGTAFLGSLFVIAWLGTSSFRGSVRLYAGAIAIGIASVLVGLSVGVLGIDRHGGTTPAAVDLTATILMGAGAALAALATLPILAAAARR